LSSSNTTKSEHRGGASFVVVGGNPGVFVIADQ
jgi:hypothetical protein